jgi:hypothetical protein
LHPAPKSSTAPAVALGSAFVFATLRAAFLGILELIGEARLYLHRRFFLFRLPRLAVASHLSFSHRCDPLDVEFDEAGPP